MENWVLLIFLIVVTSCRGQSSGLPAEVPYHRHPETPPQELLEKVSTLNAEKLKTKQLEGEAGRRVNFYYLEGIPFSGWAYQLFEGNKHRYRYTKFEEGLPVWQIGYFDNGQLDHDFHMKDGRNMGSARMWMRDGKPYIDTYFLEQGLMDGPQQRWHSNGQLARDAWFIRDSLVYEVLFDRDGVITERKGAVPQKWKH